jgi:hypothetical protein
MQQCDACIRTYMHGLPTQGCAPHAETPPKCSQVGKWRRAGTLAHTTARTAAASPLVGGAITTKLHAQRKQCVPPVGARTTRARAQFGGDSQFAEQPARCTAAARVGRADPRHHARTHAPSTAPCPPPPVAPPPPSHTHKHKHCPPYTRTHTSTNSPQSAGSLCRLTPQALRHSPNTTGRHGAHT